MTYLQFLRDFRDIYIKNGKALEEGSASPQTILETEKALDQLETLSYSLRERLDQAKWDITEREMLEFIKECEQNEVSNMSE